VVADTQTKGDVRPYARCFRHFEGSLAINKRKVLDAARKHAQKGAKAKALKEYNKLLQADPRDAKLLLEVGDAYRRWGQPDEAISHYSKVAGQYRQDGFDARAVAVFKQILNLDPKHYAAYVSLGELYQRMGLDSEAVASLQIAADGYHKEGRKKEALELLRQMAALDPSNTTSRLKVAELLRQEGMEDDAITEYEAVVAELQSQQDRDQLIVVYDRILEIRPDHVDSLTAQVRQLMSAGHLDRAEPLAVRALNASEASPQYELLIDLYAQMGNDEKLADATRALARIYRERGDEDKARELMQRLPAEGMAAPEPRLAVDLSETEEPQLDDEELLDEPFLAADDDFDLVNSSSSSLSSSLSSSHSKGAPQEPEELSLDTLAPVVGASQANAEDSSASLPLPDGDPDQLLAEASVYLRYGKRDQAIASLRSVIAQVPGHRAALEKLGEAYAEGGQNSDAAATWMKAAEQVRREGDAEALDILRDRIAALDPGLASQIAPLDPSEAAAAKARNAPAAEASDEITHTDSFGVDLELDVEVDLDLDDAIEEIAASDEEGDFSFETSHHELTATDAEAAPAEHEDIEFEIDLDHDDLGLEEGSPETSASSIAEPSTAPSDDVDFEFEDELSFETEAAAADSDGTDEFVTDALDDDDAIEFEIDTSDLTAEAFDGESTEASADDPSDEGEREALGEGGGTLANVDEEIEEAGFYIAQDMFDEAEGILGRVLKAAPNHAQALVLMGEVAASRAGADAAQPPETGPEASITTPEGLGIADRDPEVSFEVDVEYGVEDETPIEEMAPPEPVAEQIPEEVAVAESTTDASEATFDLREALADIIDDDEPTPSPDTSGVRSTVEDGFESIFSDFKKGVTDTLDAGDYDTRYDLGIAYREMGLFDDAIGEFRVCLESPDRRFDSLYLMGLCARDLGRFDDAVNHLEQALALPEIPEQRLAGVYFDLSVALEGAGDSQRACSSVQRVIELEPDFPGAAARLAALESGESAMPEVGAPGEAYESFDDLFSEDADDESGDEAIAEAVPAEAFESFDDIVSEAEAVLDAAEEDATTPEAGPDASQTDDGETKKSSRRKISFV
jgi:pilus assembly protein FimV